ncbi:CLUMA_CG004657, isoform A [Clunio marinus]|uniref:CLUMA_CG004657, isoform A n=1 Tax=Clunio marinus TaxID=568069 RepID=A0A1J1HSB5_9DIPT|nr:CLUMA_CG004657, isoform A [Clunio marinus]
MVQKQSGTDKSSKVHSVSFSELIKLGFSKNAEWPDDEIFLDWIYWSRQVVGLLFGLIWGLIPLTGFIGLALFGICSCGYVYLYCSAFGVDDEAYGGIYEIIKEGFMTNFASFLVAWIITYSSVHWDELLVERL